MAWGATISRPYAVAVFSVTASAAFRITSSTKSGWDSIGMWLLSVSKVFAPIHFGTKRSKAGWIVRSLPATMYQLGFESPSGTVPFFGPELTGRLIQDRERSPPQLFALPLLEPLLSDFVGQGSTRPHQVGETECTPEGGTLRSALKTTKPAPGQVRRI